MMEFFLAFLLLMSFCIGHPLNSEAPNAINVDNIVNYLKLNRPADPCVKTVQQEVPEFLECSLDQSVVDEIESYREVVEQIIDLFLNGNFKGKTYELLAELTDTFGPRLTGSQALDDTIEWVLTNATAEGFEVHTENVTAPHWVRNEESLVMVSPRIQVLPILGLGTTVGTPQEGITAELHIVSSFEELEETSNLAAGKIVLYDVPFTTYSETVAYRSRGAVEAARAGAVASLIRSVTDFSIASPHTGVQNYDDDVEKIPAAAITIEDAAMLHRIQDRGETITLQLNMGAENFPDILTKNTVLDIQGTEYPEEVVVVSGHLDSWDVGTGTMDDAGGCVISWMAGKTLHELNLSPRRTFRTLLFTAEEQGIYGGDAYLVAHAAEKGNFQLMMESDFGTFYPRGMAFSGNNETLCIMQKILSLTEALETTEMKNFQQKNLPVNSILDDLTKGKLRKAYPKDLSLNIYFSYKKTDAVLVICPKSVFNYFY